MQAVGSDLRSLAAAAHQLTNDFPGEQLTVEKVQRYFGGRAEAKSFAVADAAFSGRRAAALEELRWALDGGTASVLVTSAMAASARSIARYLGSPRGARRPTWRATSACRRGRCGPSATSRARGSDEAIAAAVRAVAVADADIKGQAHDASYTLERLVLTVAGLRESR